MNLTELLNSKREQMLESWVDQIIATYPEGASNFLKKKKNRFDNPVGYAISNSAGEIFDSLVNGLDIETANISLDSIIKIRAVQEFTPAQALNFIFLLKKAVRSELASEVDDMDVNKELVKFENDVDQIAMLAFNLYCEYRERLFKIRVDELSRRTNILFSQLNRTSPEAN